MCFLFIMFVNKNTSFIQKFDFTEVFGILWLIFSWKQLSTKILLQEISFWFFCFISFWLVTILFLNFSFEHQKSIRIFHFSHYNISLILIYHSKHSNFYPALFLRELSIFAIPMPSKRDLLTFLIVYSFYNHLKKVSSWKLQNIFYCSMYFITCTLIPSAVCHTINTSFKKIPPKNHIIVSVMS